MESTSRKRFLPNRLGSEHTAEKRASPAGPLPATAQKTIRMSPNIDVQKMQVLRSTRLVHAFCKLSLNEHRLLMAMASVIDPRGDYPTGGVRIEMTAADISKITGIDSTNLRRAFLMKAGNSFTSNNIRTWCEETEVVEFIPIAIKSSVDSRKCVFYADLHPELIENLVDLSRYVSEWTVPMMKLGSVRNWAIASHIREKMHSKRTGWYQVELDVYQLRFATGVNDEVGNLVVKGIADHSKFKSRILMPALNEIDKLTDIEIERKSDGKIRLSEVSGVGTRKIIKVLLTVRLRPKSLVGVANANATLPDGQSKLAAVLAQIKISPAQQEVLLKECGEIEGGRARLERNAEWTLSMILDGKFKQVTHPLGLVRYAMKNDVARLPPVANPSENPDCRRDSALRDLVQEVLLATWWELTDQERGAIEEVGAKLNSDGIALGALLREYKELKKGESDKGYALAQLRDAATGKSNKLDLIRGKKKISDLLETTLFT